MSKTDEGVRMCSKTQKKSFSVEGKAFLRLDFSGICRRMVIGSKEIRK